MNWQDRAACKDLPTEMFFPERGSHPKAAQKVCRECHVRRECLDYAIKTGTDFGVFGGLVPNQRHALIASGYWPGRNPDDYLTPKVRS
jgi:WhiB family transcriptional regulator, redox-sensing transcriptional regulator